MNLADLSDWQLLEEYAQRDSDAAFTLLVQRYVNLVYSAAVRQLPSSGMAEDVVQNVFILLARKAHRLSPKTILAGWLLQTTRHVAYTMRRSEARRSRREWQAHSLTDTSNETAVWEEIAPLLDDALAQLRESDRAAVSLRYFQHKNLVEVGEALGVTEEAAKKRVARAVERLRTFFTQRGVLVPAAVLCGLIVSRAVEIAPAGCAERVAKTASRGKSASVLPPGLALGPLLLESIGSRPRLAAGLAAAVLTLTFVAVVTQFRGSPNSRRTAPGPNTPTAASTRMTPLETALPPATLALPLRIVTAEEGRPLPRTWVHVAYIGTNTDTVELMTDNNGTCRIPLTGRAFRTVEARLDAEGYVPKSIGWFQYELGTDVEDYTARLDRGVFLHGAVRDLNGQPVAGATLNVGGYGLNLSERENFADSSVLSSVDGQWSCSQVPRDAQTITVAVEHPDFAFLSTNLLLRADESPVLVLEPGVSVSGVVIDGAGAPVEGAAVSDNNIFSERRNLFALSEAGGQFFFPHVKPGKLWLMVQQGDTQGGCEFDLTGDTDAVQLVTAPPAETLAPRTPPALDQVLHLVGTVSADDTGQSVPRFKVLLGKRVIAGATWGSSTTLGAPSLFLGEGKAGGFDWSCPLPMAGALLEFTLEIRADGYVPELSPPTSAQTSTCTFAFRLKKDQLAAGQLTTPDGNLAAGAIVLLAGTNSRPLIGVSSNQPLGLQIYSAPEARATSDAQGRFALKPVAGTDRVILLHESGCRMVPLTECTGATIRLQPWGRVAGELHIGPAFGTNQLIGIQPATLTRDARHIPFSCRNARTDIQGRFAFPRVPAGSYHVFRVNTTAGPGPRPFGFSHHVALRIDPGQTAQVQIGGHGRQVIGSIRTNPDHAVTDWTSVLPRFIGRSEPTEMPKLDAFADSATFADALSAVQPSYYLAVSSDGTFVADDVPPGSYQLNITVTRLADLPGAPPNLRLPIGTLMREITILEPNSTNPGEPVDLGALTVEVRVP